MKQHNKGCEYQDHDTLNGHLFEWVTKKPHQMWSDEDAGIMIGNMISCTLNADGDNHDIMHVDVMPLTVDGMVPQSMSATEGNIFHPHVNAAGTTKYLLGNGQVLTVHVDVSQAYCVCCLYDDVHTDAIDTDDSGYFKCDACLHDTHKHGSK